MKNKLSMRTFFLTVMIALLILTVPEIANVRAQAETHLSIEPASVSIAPGAATTLSVYVSDGLNLNAFDITILYDTGSVTLESWSHGSYLANLATIINQNTPGRLHLVSTQLATPGASGNGVLLNLVFRGTAVGSATVTIQDAQLANSASELVIPTLSNGLIRVEDTVIPTATLTSTLTPTPTLTPSPTSTLTPTLTQTATPTRTATITSTIGITRTSTRTPSFSVTGLPAAGRTPTSSAGFGILPLPTQGGQTPQTGVTPVNPENAQSGQALPSPTGIASQQFAGSAEDQVENLKAVNLFLWIAVILLITILLCAIGYYFIRKKRE